MKRHERRALAIGILLLCAVAVGLTGCGIGSSSSDGREMYTATIDGKAYALEYRLRRPNDSVAHPLIIMTHGRDGPHPERNPDEADGYGNLCEALAQRGYVVMILVRSRTSILRRSW